MSRYLVKARNRAESTEQSRFPPPRVDFCSVGSPRACRVFEWAIAQPIVRDDPWHHIDQLCIRALTSARAFAAATCRARPRARRRRSLNILTAREPMGPSSRRRLILLASHCMALARERKKPSRIAREIEIFSIFAGWVPTLVPKHNSRFRIFRHTLCWSLYSINIYETFGRNKIAVSLWNQNGMVSYTCKDSIRSPECLAYWSRWLEVSPMNRHWPGFDSWQFAPQAEQCRWAGNCKFYNFFIFKKLEILNQVLI